ncbi:MAG: hypothetical protein ACWGMZ_09085 [Thermoguttaceae bacterium]
MSNSPVPSAADRDMQIRQDFEQPAAIDHFGWRFHHIGIPCDIPRPGERYLEHLKMYVSGFETSPYGIEWIRFERDSPVPELVRKVPHIAFEVDDLNKAIEGKELLGEVTFPSPHVRVAMIVYDGAPVELIEFSKNSS